MEGFSRLNWIEMTHILDLKALLLEDPHTRLDTLVTDRTLVAPPPGLGHVGPCLTFDWSLSLSAMMLALGIALLVITLCSAMVTYDRELQNVNTLTSLLDTSWPKVLVKREGITLRIPGEELVPGDLVVVGPWEPILADLRVLRTDNCYIDYSGITGCFGLHPLLPDAVQHSTDMASATNMLFMRSVLQRGTATGLVVATGYNTVYGAIARVATYLPEVNKSITKEIYQFFLVIGATVVFYTLVTLPLDLDISSIFELFSLIVITNIPEGLLPTLTVFLILSSQRLVEKRCFVRSLDTMDTLGTTSVMVFDKTGTITENRLKVCGVWLEGHIYQRHFKHQVLGPCQFSARLWPLLDLRICGMYWDPVDKAIETFSRKLARYLDLKPPNYVKIFEQPFTYLNKYSLTVNRDQETKELLICMKGAPEVLVHHCNKEMKHSKILKAGKKIAGGGDIVLGFTFLANSLKLQTLLLGLCQIRLPAIYDLDRLDLPPSHMAFVGLLSMADYVRPGVRSSIRLLRMAGLESVLDQNLSGKWIGRRGPIEFPARSPDLTPLDFFLWGTVKDGVYKRKPRNLDILWNEIQAVCREISLDVLIRCTESVVTRTQNCIDAAEATKIDSVLKAFDSHFCVRKNIIYERAKFNSRIQEDREPVDEFITSLYKLADSCEFEGLHEQLIRDRIVVGVRDKALSERMQLDSELTLEKGGENGSTAASRPAASFNKPKVNQVKFNSKKQSPKQQQQPSRKKKSQPKQDHDVQNAEVSTTGKDRLAVLKDKNVTYVQKLAILQIAAQISRRRLLKSKLSELYEEIGFLLEVSAVEDSSNLMMMKASAGGDGQQKFKAAEFSELQTVGEDLCHCRLSESLLSRRACELLNLARRIEVGATKINPIKEFPEVFEGLGQIGNPYEIKLKPGQNHMLCILLDGYRVPIPSMEKFKTRLDIPGKELLDADALSRQPLLTTEGDEMLTKIFEAQQEDTTLKAVVNYLEQGWPDKKKMSQTLLSYWHVKDELGVQNGLLMRICRLVIPASMKLEILDKLHAGHFGITKTRLRARETVWWPGISEEIAETVRKCSVCIQEAVSKHEPLIPTNFPTRPWQKIGMDLFNCKSIFARHGIPETAVSDNGTQFGAAREFANFARQYGFTHVTSSPRFPQSNGMAEAGVKIAKLILKKNQDPSLGLLEYDRHCGSTDMEELSEVGTLRRNRFHLRKGDTVQYPADPSTPTFSGEELVENEKTPVVDYPSNDSEDGQIRTRNGFLLYYSENEKKSFDKKGTFNIHPKGVIPLGGCSVKPIQDCSNPFLIKITSDEFKWDHVLLLADTPMERERWTLIRELESQGLQLSKEKQDCFEKLQEETTALRDEMERNEELQRLALELEREKLRLESLISQMKEDHERSRRDVDETAMTLKVLEEDKQQLTKTAEMLQTTLEELAMEKEKTLELLHLREEETQNLYLTAEELYANLNEIEEDTRLVHQEKSELEQRFLENQMKTQLLEEERQIFSEQANYLLSSLNELTAQKELTEAELREEVLARLNAERKIRNAEQALVSMEATIRELNSDIFDSAIDRLLPDMVVLRDFFRTVAQEAEITADKPLILKNSLVARKSFVHRAKSVRVERARQEKSKFTSTLVLTEVESTNGVKDNGVADPKSLKRSKSLVGSQQKLRSLKRSMSVNRATVRCIEPTLASLEE
ncbi:PLEKHD1 [Cordylochernes scorpioides]|uniref:PLEKHD1 n=1 Tax=Cordylochernes scorpioides TaxID=51811 RepID=A0ABY6LTE4_9ARAC|nr:PLEKHD1 [Cordylochernes scorpioides]